MGYMGLMDHISSIKINKLASLEATLVRNYDRLTHSLTGVKCRATSVAKNIKNTCVDELLSHVRPAACWIQT